MRIPPRFQSFATLLFAASVATCSDNPNTAPRPVAVAGRARLAFAPVFSKEAQAVYAQRNTFAAVDFDKVRVVIVRPPADTVKDTTIVFTPGSPDVTLDLTVDVRTSGESFTAGIDYANASGVVFHGEGKVQSHAASDPAPPAQPITVNYVGPGSTVARIAVAPKTATIVAPSGVNFTVTAFDASNAPVPIVPINWQSSDATIATINAATGALTTTGKRGTVTVTASTPTHITDNASVTVTLPPAAIALLSGGGQTGKVGATLAQPAVVRVTASDGISLSGVNVTFAAPIGGKVGTASALSDANGMASTSLTLGPTIGPQSFAAVAAGSFTVSIPATATQGDPASITAQSGGGQQDTVKHALKNPFVVKVTDQFGNAVAGATATWSRTAGTGAVANPTSVTDANGSASMNYTLGATPGTETVQATVAGVNGAATFTAQALPAGPASIVAVSGTPQNGRALQPLAAPFVVKVTDEIGGPVNNVKVSWTATNGTIAPTTTTDAQGQSSNTMTLGKDLGAASATATVSTPNGSKSVTFSATVQPGVVAQLVFRANPSTGTAGAVLTPSIQLELRDAGGNLTAATNSVSIALGNNPSGAALTGTLTRNAVAGVATFNDLVIDKAGSGFTLVGSSAGVPNATSAPFNVVAGVPGSIVVVAGDNQTPTVNTAVSVAPSVKVLDASNNPVPNAAVTFTPAAGSGAVQPAAPITTNAQGIATLTSWTVGQTAGQQTLNVSTGGGLTIAMHATAQAGAATALSIATQPSAAAQSGVPFAQQPVVRLQDSFNNPVSQAGVVVTAAIATGGGTLGGTLTATTNASGVAAFSNLSITGPSGSRTLSFTASGLASATSSSITLGAGAPTQLAISTQPSSSAQNGVAFAQQPVIQLQDASNNAAAQAGVVITASIATGGGTLGGTVTATTNGSGVATFANLSITGTAGVRTLAFSAPSFTPVTSGTVTISAGAASQLAIATQPSASAQSGVPFAQQPAIQLQDPSNNPVGQAGVVVTASIANGGGVLGGTVTATTNASGVATFTNLSITGASGARTLSFAASGLTSATSSSITLGAGAASQLAITTQPSSSAQNGVAFGQQPVIQLQDASNNPASQAGVVVTAAIATGGGTLGGTLTATTNASGVATFTNLSITGTVGARTLTFTAPSLTSATSGTVTVSAGAATQLAITTQPSASAQSGVAFAQQPAIQLQDVSNNPVSQAGVVVTAAIATGGGTLGGTLTATTNASGVATFTNLSITGASGARTLSFSAAGLTGATSSSITLGAGAASQLAITTQPSSSVQHGVVFPQQPVIQLQDASNNPVSQAGVAVTVSIATGGGTLGGTLTVTTNASGVATFTNLSMTGTVGARTLSFTAPSLTSATSGTVTLTAGVATQLAIATQPSASAQSGVAFAQQPAIQLQDASTNAVSQAGVVVTASIATGGGTLGGTLTATTNASGVATFTNLSITGTSGTRTLNFTAGGLSGATSSSITLGAGAASQLAIATQPSSSAQSGVAFAQQPVIQLQDASNNAANQSGVVITASIATGGGTLGGTLTATTNASGVATFTNLSITGTVGARTLTFSAPSLTPATSGTVTVSAGAASKLAIATQPSASVQNGAAFPQQPVIQLQDASSNAVSQAGVVVTASIATGGGTLGGTLTATTNASGVATFTNLSITGATGGRTLSFTAPSLTSATSGTVTVTAGAATQLSITTQPSTSVQNGAAFPQQPVIQLQDASSNAVSQAGVVVTASIATGGGTLGGTLTATTNASGVATFTNLSITGTAGARTLSFTAPSLASATSGTVTVTAGAATQLSITTQPSASVQNGATFPQQPVIQLQDVSSNPVSQAGVVVTASIATGGGTLGGTLTATTNASGVASFTNLSITGTVGGRTLQFTAPSLTSATSNTVNVTAGAATQLSISTQPSASVQNGAAFPQQPVIQLQDASNNPVSQNGVVVTASIATGGGTLGGTLTATTNASGVATFTNLSITGTAGGRTLSFTAPSLASATSGTVNVTAGAATQLSITTQPSASVQNGAAFPQQPVIQLQDASNNPVSQNGVVVTASIATGGGTLGGTLTATTNASGVATFTNLSITGTVGARTLTFSAPSLAPVTSGTVNVTAGAATQMSITTQPSSSAQSGVVFAQQPVIQLQDVSNNPVSQSGVVVTASIQTGAGTLGGTLTATTNASGVATFTNLVITGAAGNRTLNFDATGLTTASSGTILITAGAATKLIIATQPSTSAQSGVAFPQQPVIQLQDASSNPVSQAGVVVTAALASGTGTLGGTLTATTNASGAATFANLKINGTSGNTYTIGFTSGSLTSATSSTITLSAGVAASLTFTQQPTSTAVSQSLTPAVTVTVKDADNNIVTSPAVTVAVAIHAGTGTSGAILGGTTSTSTTNGVATFANLTIDRVGTGYQLDASSVGVPTITSTTFDIAGTPQNLAWTLTAYSTTVGTPLPAGSYPKVQLTDAAHNGVPNQSVTIRAAGGACATIPSGGATATTDGSGFVQMTSSNLTVSASAGSCRLSASFSDFSSVAAVVVAPTTMVTWLGLTDNLWSTATNWRSGAVPSTTNAVYVPAWLPTSRWPQLVANTTIGGLTLEADFNSRVTLDVTGHALTINGDVFAGTGNGGGLNTVGIVSNPSGGTVTLSTPGTSNLQGDIMVPTTIGTGTAPCNGTNIKVVGLTTINSSLDVYCGLEAVSGVLGVFSTFRTLANTQTLSFGTLTMNQPTALVSVGGAATFDGGTSQLSAGTLSVDGDLTITQAYGSFLTSGSHTLEFIGTGGLQTFNFNAEVPLVQNLVVRNNAPGGRLAIPLQLIVNGNLTVDGNSSIVRPTCGECGIELFVRGNITANAGSDLSDVGVLYAQGGSFPTILGNSPQTLKIASAMTLTAPTTYTGHIDMEEPITLNGNAFTVHGGYVLVEGNGAFLAFNGATVTIDNELDLLTDGGGTPWANGTTGTLVLGGHLYQGETTPTTLGGSGLTVRLNGTSEQTIYVPNSFNTSAATFNNLLIANPSVVDIADPFRVGGVLNVLSNAVFQIPYNFADATTTVTLLSGAVLKLQSGSHFTINGNGNITPITTSTCRRFNGTPTAVVDGGNTATVNAILSASTCTQTSTP